MSATAETTDGRAEQLAQSTAMTPVAGTTDVDVPADVLWKLFRRPDLWPRWNACMFWAWQRELVAGDELIWVFEPIRWWFLYKLPAIARIVELDEGRKVTWEITAVPGFYARHSFTVEDLGGGRSRFGSWEQAMGPTFEAMAPFWLAHFAFVRDASLDGAHLLAGIYARDGRIDDAALPAKSYRQTVIALVILWRLAGAVRRMGRRRRVMARRSGRAR